jgi:hypothetical protein
VQRERAGAAAGRAVASPIASAGVTCTCLAPNADRPPVHFRVRRRRQPPQAAHGSDIDAQGIGTVDARRLYQIVRQQQRRATRRDRVPRARRRGPTRSRSGDAVRRLLCSPVVPRWRRGRRRSSTPCAATPPACGARAAPCGAGADPGLLPATHCPYCKGPLRCRLPLRVHGS